MQNGGVQVDFTVNATMVMRRDDSEDIFDAEVTDRGRLRVAERFTPLANLVHPNDPSVLPVAGDRSITHRAVSLA